MRFNEGVYAVAAGIGCAVLMFGSVSAQEYDRGRNVSVLERERKDYDALGVHVGSFSVFPKLDARLVYSSNVFADETNEQSDQYLAFNPNVEARSNWSRHQLQADVGLRLRRYADNTGEDQDGWYARTTGRLDIFGSSYATAMVEAERLYEERGSSDFPGGAAEPLPIDAVGFNLRGVGQFSRMRLSVGGAYRELDFDNVPLVFNPTFPLLTILDTSGRDREITTLDTKAEWAVSPDTAVFGQVQYIQTNYRRDAAPFQNRDSEETGVTVGANFDLSALIRGEIGAGYLRRSYDDPAFGDVSGLSFQGVVEYFPTQMTTLTLNVRRSVEDSVLVGTSGYFLTGAGLRVDHEFRRNILLNAVVDYEDQSFDSIDRSDQITSFSAGGTYLLNRTVGLNANIGYVNHDSSGLARYRSFDETRASIGIILQR